MHRSWYRVQWWLVVVDQYEVCFVIRRFRQSRRALSKTNRVPVPSMSFGGLGACPRLNPIIKRSSRRLRLPYLGSFGLEPAFRKAFNAFVGYCNRGLDVWVTGVRCLGNRVVGYWNPPHPPGY